MAEAMLFATKTSVAATAMEYISNDIAETRELLLDDDGVRGQRAMQLERATQGLIKVAGNIKMNPTPLELSTLWPYLVQNSTGTVLTDAMQDVTVVLDLQTKANTFLGRFDKFTIGGKPGKKLDLNIHFVGYTCTVGSGGTVSGNPDITNRPYMMQDAGSGITIGGTVYNFDDVEFDVDNMIEPTFMIGQVATDLYPSGREVSLNCRFRYNTAEAALLTTAQAGPVLTPVTGSLAFTNGANSVSFAFGAMIAEPATVKATEKKLRLPLKYRCLKVGVGPGVLEVVTTFV